jgi:hypothetical protein
MAQRKPPSPSNKPSPANKPATGRTDGKPGARTSAKVSTTKVSTAKKKPGKSIVNQKQTPWGLIVTTAVIVVFAVGIVVFAVTQHKSGGNSSASDNPYTQPELAEVKSIQGLTYKKEPDHNHVQGVIKYDSTPPVGGNHSQYWADCTGTVYAQPIANENAVHMLEHGAIWITYNAKTLPADQLAVLKKKVAGIDRMALSPFPDLKSPISLQAWGYQLFVDKASDPRIDQFISALKYNPKITPEYGATCSQPTFKQNPSTFGHPLWQPASGASGNTMP